MTTKKTNGNGNGQNGHHKKKFLEGYVATGTISGGALFAGVHRHTVYQWQENSETFKADFEAVKDEVADKLEQEAIRRALTTSDTMLIFLLKGQRPEKYGDKTQHEVTVKPYKVLEDNDDRSC